MSVYTTMSLSIPKVHKSVAYIIISCRWWSFLRSSILIFKRWTLCTGSVPVRTQFLPVGVGGRWSVAGAQLSRLGLADTERVVVPRSAGADARGRPTSDAVDVRRPSSRFAVDHRPRRRVWSCRVHVCRVGVDRGVGWRSTSIQRYRLRQGQRSLVRRIHWARFCE